MAQSFLMLLKVRHQLLFIPGKTVTDLNFNLVAIEKGSLSLDTLPEAGHVGCWETASHTDALPDVVLLYLNRPSFKIQLQFETCINQGDYTCICIYQVFNTVLTVKAVEAVKYPTLSEENAKSTKPMQPSFCVFYTDLFESTNNNHYVFNTSSFCIFHLGIDSKIECTFIVRQSMPSGFTRFKYNYNICQSKTVYIFYQ